MAATAEQLYASLGNAGVQSILKMLQGSSPSSIGSTIGGAIGSLGQTPLERAGLGALGQTIGSLAAPNIQNLVSGLFSDTGQTAGETLSNTLSTGNLISTASDAVLGALPGLTGKMDPAASVMAGMGTRLAKDAISSFISGTGAGLFSPTAQAAGTMMEAANAAATAGQAAGSVGAINPVGLMFTGQTNLTNPWAGYLGILDIFTGGIPVLAPIIDMFAGGGAAGAKSWKKSPFNPRNNPWWQPLNQQSQDRLAPLRETGLTEYEIAQWALENGYEAVAASDGGSIEHLFTPQEFKAWEYVNSSSHGGVNYGNTPLWRDYLAGAPGKAAGVWDEYYTFNKNNTYGKWAPLIGWTPRYQELAVQGGGPDDPRAWWNQTYTNPIAQELAAEEKIRKQKWLDTYSIGDAVQTMPELLQHGPNWNYYIPKSHKGGYYTPGSYIQQPTDDVSVPIAGLAHSMFEGYNANPWDRALEQAKNFARYRNAPEGISLKNMYVPERNAGKVASLAADLAPIISQQENLASLPTKIEKKKNITGYMSPMQYMPNMPTISGSEYGGYYKTAPNKFTGGV